jgi:hypothetical protein
MAVWLLALTVAVLLVGALAVRASAAPASPQPPTPSPTAPVPLPLPTVGTCAPNTPLPVCDLPTQTSTPSPGNTGTPTTTAPCTGEDCIPQPTNQPPGTGQPSNNGGGGSGGGSDCGVFDITACISDAINNIFQGLVNAALSPILDLIGHTALSTPTLSSLPGIGDLWNNSWGLVLAAYGFFVLIGGIIVMSHESVQTRYSIKEIGPRIPLAFIASALSLFFADKFIQLANALSLAVLGGGVDAPTLGSTLQDAVQGAQSGGLFVILVGLVLVVVGLGLLIVYVVRIVITLILIISGPLFLMCHALPPHRRHRPVVVEGPRGNARDPGRSGTGVDHRSAHLPGCRRPHLRLNSVRAGHLGHRDRAVLHPVQDPVWDSRHDQGRVRSVVPRRLGARLHRREDLRHGREQNRPARPSRRNRCRWESSRHRKHRPRWA